MDKENEKEEQLTANDKALLDEAYNFDDYSRWGYVESLVKKADTERAKRLLHTRASWLYHTDEYSDGLL